MRIPSPWFAILVLGTNAIAADKITNWPQFRGPGGHGRGDASAPTEFAAGSGRWKTEIPAGHPSPSVWGDRIFLTTGDKQTKKLETLCVDRSTGKVLWRRSLQAEKIERLRDVGNPAYATPAVDGERVYVYFGSYGLIAYNLEGEPQWMMPLPLADKASGGATSTVVSGEVILLNRDDREEAYLLAVDRRSGKVAWKQSYGAPNKRPGTGNTSTPLLWHGEIVIHRADEIGTFDAKTGAKTWWVSVQSTGVGHLWRTRMQSMYPPGTTSASPICGSRHSLSPIC
jgi:outer membrane protein assembly factor BamB